MDTLNNEVMKETPATAPESSGLIMKSGGTTFVIGLHFSETSKDTLDDKVKKLIKKDVENDNF